MENSLGEEAAAWAASAGHRPTLSKLRKTCWTIIARDSEDVSGDDAPQTVKVCLLGQRTQTSNP